MCKLELKLELQFRSGFERSDHQMIDDGDQNVDDVSPIKLDTIKSKQHYNQIFGPVV